MKSVNKIDMLVEKILFVKQLLVDLVVIDVIFDREMYDSISHNCDRKEIEII